MPKLLSKKKKNDRELCQIIATSITEIVRDSLNPTFRQTYFNTIQVTNSTDAQEFLENRLLNVLGVNKSFNANLRMRQTYSNAHHPSLSVNHSSPNSLRTLIMYSLQFYCNSKVTFIKCTSDRYTVCKYKALTFSPTYYIS